MDSENGSAKQSVSCLPGDGAAATDANAAADLAGSRYLRGFDAEGNTVSVHVVESLVSDAKAAPFLLLLPFTAAHSRQMLMFARRIRRAGVHAVCVDLPGHGRSGGDRGKFHILQLMRTIRTLLEHYHRRLPNSPLVVAGSSWGGDLSLLYALWEQQQLLEHRQTRLADAVIAQAVIVPWMRDLFVQFRKGVNLLFEPTGFCRELVRLALGKTLPVSQMFRLKDVYQRDVNRRRFAADRLTLKAYDSASYLGYLQHLPAIGPELLQIPVHLLIGERDRLVPLAYERQVHERLHRLNPETTLSVIPGGSHAVFEENVPQTIEAIFGLLARLRAPQAGTRQIEPRRGARIFTGTVRLNNERKNGAHFFEDRARFAPPHDKASPPACNCDDRQIT